MARKAGKNEIAPETFTPVPGTVHLKYKIELITPMAGGGTKSWQPDFNNPVRSQAIKGHLRYWWRSMQLAPDAKSLKEREDKIWGSTEHASQVRLQVKLPDELTSENIRRNCTLSFSENENNLPGYVFFPLRDADSDLLLKDLRFELVLFVPEENRPEVENSVKLWLLFGGLGARNRRGCGSLYCKEVMREFQEPANINRFIQDISSADAEDFGHSPYPVISNCILACSQITQGKPSAVWCSLLNAYEEFRLGRKKEKIAKSLWPEADAIRSITGEFREHRPEHPAGNWFPRGAYGLPIMMEFGASKKKGDPQDKYSLQPEGCERWPSPVTLKIIKLDEKHLLKICLILNHAVPENLVLSKKGRNDWEVLHVLEPAEKPMAFTDKKMPPDANMLHSGENPYDALIRHLNLREERP